ncbi:hypothetical protein EJ04DRAFT_37075 [Polyplosphaeria fusca]|uniref:Uncharacterized protein n=1 Tax=Polyplosphaeria fusca TaxID=682080 RepID=A0A9P4UZ42_9PLEO|nr:hypothetical protein EJ04DRAFT_37075 [Polyplosphaeria fusca]
MRMLLFFVRRRFTAGDISLLLNDIDDMTWEAQCNRRTLKTWASKTQSLIMKTALAMAVEIRDAMVAEFSMHDPDGDFDPHMSINARTILAFIRDFW